MLFRSIADMQDGVLVLDRDGRVAQHNPQAQRLLGALAALSLSVPALAACGTSNGASSADGKLVVGSPRNHATNIEGLYAAGECEYQYHGANRLGANSLLSCIFSGLFVGPGIQNLLAGGERVFLGFAGHGLQRFHKKT